MTVTLGFIQYDAQNTSVFITGLSISDSYKIAKGFIASREQNGEPVTSSPS